jgi:hypothetical protein
VLNPKSLIEGRVRLLARKLGKAALNISNQLVDQRSQLAYPVRVQNVLCGAYHRDRTAKPRQGNKNLRSNRRGPVGVD